MLHILDLVRGSLPWKVITLAVLILGCATFMGQLMRWRSQDKLAHEEFLAEADARFGYSQAIPLKEIRDYNNAKEQTFKLIKDGVAKGKTLEEANTTDPKTSWMRKLDDPAWKDHHARLCKLLLMRALSNMPRYQLLTKDFKSKFLLYQKKLITEQQWVKIQQAQSALGKELNFIRSEAEKLKEGWSKQDQIFQDSAKLAEHLRRVAPGRVGSGSVESKMG